MTAPILQDPVNEAPGSIDSLLVIMSPFNLAVDFKDNNCATEIFALIVPETSASVQTTSPSITPSFPKTTLPEVLTDPFKVPSTLISPLD